MRTGGFLVRNAELGAGRRGKAVDGTGAAGRNADVLDRKQVGVLLKECLGMGAFKPTDAVALTVDDGPSGETTPLLLDNLRDADARAIFFMVGANLVESARPLLQRMINEGHVLGGHTMDHANLRDITEADLERNLDSMEEAFISAVGDRPWIFRAPEGNLNPVSLEVLCRRNYIVMDWDVDTRDWAWTPDPEEATYDRQLSLLADHKGGGILLLHDKVWTAAAFPALASAVESGTGKIRRFADPLELLPSEQRLRLVEASCGPKGSCAHASTRPWCDCVGAHGVDTPSHAPTPEVLHDSVRIGDGPGPSNRSTPALAAVLLLGVAILAFYRLARRRRAQGIFSSRALLRSVASR